MRNPGGTTVEVWEPGGAAVYNPATGDLDFPPDTLVATVRASFGVLKAEEQYQRATGLDENVSAYALMPLAAPVTTDRYLVVLGHDAIAGRWAIVGIEWRRTHLRVLLRQGFQAN